jgi:hypothetical protein
MSGNIWLIVVIVIFIGLGLLIANYVSLVYVELVKLRESLNFKDIENKLDNIDDSLRGLLKKGSGADEEDYSDD